MIPVLTVPLLSLRIWLAPMVIADTNHDLGLKCTLAFGNRIWIKARLVQPREVLPFETKSPVLTLRAELDL